MDFGLMGKKVIILGGSKGIGLVIVNKFLDEGVFVGFFVWDKLGVDVVVVELLVKGKVLSECLDVGDFEVVKVWVVKIGEEFGGIDIVVNNVSVLV